MTPAEATGAPRGPRAEDCPFTLSPEELHEHARDLLRLSEQELEKLLDQNVPRTVDHFLEPLNRLLSRVENSGTHGQLLFAVHPDPAVRKAGREVSESTDRFFISFLTNERAYRALGQLPVSSMDSAARFAVSKMMRDMRRNGVELDAVGRTRVLELSSLIRSTANQYLENISSSVRFIEVASPSELEGMPADFLASHRPGEKGAIRISVDYPDLLPVCTYCKSSEVRRRLVREWMNRAYPENAPVAARLLELRAELAHLLGYPNFAAYAIEDKMLASPEAVHALLDRTAAFLRPLADLEFARQLERKRQDDPTASSLGPWDLRIITPGYYEQKLMEEEFGDTTGPLRNYLPYGRVRDGLFALCEQLFGITITRASEAQVWHASVEAFDVRNKDSPLGRFYLDLTPRPGKYTHNATFPVRVGLEGVELPQAALVCNFLDPRVARDNVRMQHGDVVQFFHEFGHLLHNLFSGHGRWLYNSGFRLEWDFIEVPSQLFEEWARDPEVLQRFAENPDTREQPPPALLRRLRSVDKFGRAGYWLTLVGWSSAALEIHERDPANMDLPGVLKASIVRYCPIPHEPDYHLETGWPHLPGYSAYFYTYLWSMILARDILQPFHERGSLTDPEVSRRYMTEVLAPDSNRPAKDLFQSFLGREFSFDAFERWVRDA